MHSELEETLIMAVADLEAQVANLMVAVKAIHLATVVMNDHLKSVSEANAVTATEVMRHMIDYHGQTTEV